MNVRKLRDELADIRGEVEETADEPVVVVGGGYTDQGAGPPVVLCRLPGMVIMVDPRDAGL